MKKAVMILVMAILVSGCAAATPRKYVHPTKDQAAFNHDSYDCEAEVLARTPPNMRGNPFYQTINAPQDHQRCMEQKYGWRVEK